MFNFIKRKIHRSIAKQVYHVLLVSRLQGYAGRSYTICELSEVTRTDLNILIPIMNKLEESGLVHCQEVDGELDDVYSVLAGSMPYKLVNDPTQSTLRKAVSQNITAIGF